MSKSVIVIANDSIQKPLEVVGPFSTQGKAMDSVNELAVKQKPKLAKGEKFETELSIVGGNLVVDCKVVTADEERFEARLSILPMGK